MCPVLFLKRMYAIDVPEAEQWARGPLVWPSAFTKKSFILQLQRLSFAGIVSRCDLEALEMANNSACFWNECIDQKTIAGFPFSRMVIFKWTIILFICTVFLREELQKTYFYVVFLYLRFYAMSSVGETLAEVTLTAWPYWAQL